MKFTIQNNEKVATLIELFKVIKSLNNFCKMHCNLDELFIQIMDDSHVSLLEIKIKSEWFDSYETTNEVISFNSKILTIIMSFYKNNSVVSFESNEEYLDINFKQDDKTEKCFQINLIDLESDIMESQDIEHSLEFSIDTKTLDQYFSEMQSFGDTLELVHYNDTIFMRSHGDEGKYMIKITNDLLDDLIVEEDLQFMCKVPLRFVSLITKLHSTFKKINVNVSEESPLTLKFFQQNENTDLVNIKFFIAPKVEEDDNFDFSEFEENIPEAFSEEELDKYENVIIED
tara:strand:- start:5625 stop:6485 length:861 start_codon:yes stop_codon:yes gene_type:complete